MGVPNFTGEPFLVRVPFPAGEAIRDESTRLEEQASVPESTIQAGRASLLESTKP